MISVNLSYYNEPHWLAWWYNTVRRLNEDGIDIRLNVADDGSMRSPADKFFEVNPPTDKMRLFRITEDLGFNSHGARNLLMKQTETDWNLMTDIDRHYTDETLIPLATGTYGLEEGHYYSFHQTNPVSQDKPREDRYSVNEYVVHRKDFWNSGGYDEEFVNIHWGDRIFLQCLQYVAKRVMCDDLRVEYVRGARKVSVSDTELTLYPDDNTLIVPKHSWWTSESKRKAMIDMVTERSKTPEGRASKKVINFPWIRVF